MAIINKNLLPGLSTCIQNKVKVKQEENPAQNENSSDTEKEPDKNTFQVEPKIKSCTLGNDLLLTYRGINIDHMETAQEKTPVVSSKTGVVNETKTFAADKYLVDTALAKKALENITKTANGGKVFNGNQNNIISIISSYAKGDLRRLYNQIKAELTKELGYDYDEELIDKIANEAIEKTIISFTQNKKEKQKTCVEATGADKGFVISRMTQSNNSKFSNQRGASYDLKNLCNTFVKAFNEGIKNCAQQINENYATMKAAENEPQKFNPADYTVNSSMAEKCALGSSYINSETARVRGNETNIITLLNQSAYKYLQKVSDEIKKQIMGKTRKNYNADVVDSVIRQAINQTIASIAENPQKTRYIEDLDENFKSYMLTTNAAGKVISGTYNVKALIDMFLENINKQIAGTTVPEDLIKSEPMTKYSPEMLNGRYGITDSILKLYYDTNVEPNGKFSYTIKDEYKNIKPAQIRNHCYQRVFKSLIIQNFISGKIDYSKSNGVLRTKNGTPLNTSNFHLFMDEITLYADDKSSYSQEAAIQKLQKEFAKGNISFNQCGAIANALGAKNIKQTIVSNNYKLSFKLDGHDYNLLCSKTAGRNGSDDKTVTLYTKSDLEKHGLSEKIISRYFLGAISVDGEISHYTLVEGKTIESLESLMKGEKIQSTFKTYNDRYGKAFSDEKEFSDLFENAKTSALELINKNNIKKTDDILAIFDKALSTTVNNYLWEMYETEKAKEEEADKQKYYRSARPMSTAASRSKDKSPAVSLSHTIPAKDGGTITINFDGAFVNGILVTNPKTNAADCTITFTDKNGNTSSMPFSIRMDLLPEPNKKALEQYQHDYNYGKAHSIDEFLFYNTQYKETDFYSQKQWFEKVIEQVSSALEGVSDKVIKDLIDKKTTFMIDSEEYRPMSSPDAAGTYLGRTNTLSLYTSIDKSLGNVNKTPFTSYVITHEVGHMKAHNNGHDQSNYLTDENDKFETRFEKPKPGSDDAHLAEEDEKWNKLKSLIPAEYQNAYALTNKQEFFAEYYTYKNLGTTKPGDFTHFKNQLTSLNMFLYLDKELKNNPNSDLSRLYGKMKTNADKIINHNPADNKAEDTAGKQNSVEDILNNLKEDWTNDKINIKDIGGDWADIAETWGLKMQTKDILAEYYKHFYLNEPSEVINKLETASGNTKYGDPIQDLWKRMKENTPYGNGLKGACDEYDKQIKKEENANPIVPDKNTNTGGTPKLNVSGTINAKNVTGFVRTGDGLFLKADSKGSFTSEFYENAVRAAIEKYGEGLSISFTAQSDGTINYTIMSNESGRVSDYLVIDANSGFILQGSIDNSDSTNLTAADKMKFKKYAENHSLEEMMTKNLNSVFNFKSEFPTKLTPIFIQDKYMDPKTGKLDTVRMLKDLFLNDTNIIYTGNNSFSGTGNTAGKMYLAILASLAQTQSMDSAIEAFNQMTKDQRFQNSWAGGKTESWFNDMQGGGAVYDRIGTSFIGFALLSDTFASFNKTMLTKHGASIYETEQTAIEYSYYISRMITCLTGGGGGAGSYGPRVDTELVKAMQDIFQKYDDPTERMIAIINATDFGNTWDTRLTEFAKKLQEELDKERNVSHGAFTPGGSSSIINNNYKDTRPPVILPDEDPKDPFAGQQNHRGDSIEDKTDDTDPFKKPDRPPVKKF